MQEFRIVPPVYAKTGDVPIDRDLSLALVFWTLEDQREKGGGFFRKKDAERVTQVAIVYRPVLVTKYVNNHVAFDGCRVVSTEFEYGIAPSLTYLRNYLISDTWESKPESYARGLDPHAQGFEKALDEYTHTVPGWIRDPVLLGQLSDVLEVSSPSEFRKDALPQLVSYEEVNQHFEDLDKLKHALGKEISYLQELELELSEKTAEVLAPIKEEYARIENQHDKRINEIRPSVTSNQQKYEDQRRKGREEIEEGIEEQLSDLKDRLDDVNSKIDSYESSGRAPRGGIDKQYSLRDSLESRIRELESEKTGKIDSLNERYDRLIEQEQQRIDSLEEAKQKALKEPAAKIKQVQSATDRLSKAIRALSKSHESVISIGQSSGLVLPKQVQTSKFVAYVPITVARFEAGSKTRRVVYSVSVLKDSKGKIGTLKGWVGMKQSPLEKDNESLVTFATKAIQDPRFGGVISVLASRFDVLQDPQTMGLVTAGIAKLQEMGWMKPKEAFEFQKSAEDYFAPLKPSSLPVANEIQFPSEEEKPKNFPPSVRFVTYNGVESWVTLDKLEDLRKSDEEEFNKGAPGAKSATGESSRLLRYLKSIRIPHDKQYCVEKKEDWVQNQLYIMLANSEFRARVHRERTFTVKDTESRIDFDVSGIGVEVKIFHSAQDFQRLASEMIHYTREYSEIIVPYINAGMTDERVDSEFRFLTEKFREIRGYFELNCADIEH